MSKPLSAPSLFCRRLKEARLSAGIAQDQLGVRMGLDEGSSSARISRYETGIHEPPFAVIEQMATILKVPVPYFFCADDKFAQLMLIYFSASKSEKQAMIDAVLAAK
jgi:transcriptional regulator with XRE-family HTH domain